MVDLADVRLTNHDWQAYARHGRDPKGLCETRPMRDIDAMKEEIQRHESEATQSHGRLDSQPDQIVTQRHGHRDDLSSISQQIKTTVSALLLAINYEKKKVL